MTAGEVQAIVAAELDGTSPATTASHRGVDLDRCLVVPRRVPCRNTFPHLGGGKALPLWVVFEETPGEAGGYLIVFDDRRRRFGLADWGGDGRPVFLGYYGSFLDALRGM